jgi:hypothetical protein
MENEPPNQMEVERLHDELSRVEQAQLLQWMVQNLGDAQPWIESEPSLSAGNDHRAHGSGVVILPAQRIEQPVPPQAAVASATERVLRGTVHRPASR